MNFFKKQHGQSLVEVMMALSILTVGLSGIMALLGQSLFLNKAVNNETAGAYLAAEGIEVTKSLIYHDMYDHIFGTGTGWGSCFPAGGDFEIDYTVTQCAALHVYPAGNPDLLEFNPTTKQYLYAFNDLVGGGVPTMYSRRIRVVQASPSETVVQSVVSWSTGAFTSQSVNLEDHFYNWYP